MGGLTGLRVASRLLLVGVLVASGGYVLVYLYRWEWNRALMAGVFFLAAEIALVGAALALMAYFIVRSGLLLDGGLGTNITPFGIAALSGIVGLASKQIVDKLRTVSDTTFNTENDAGRIDKL